MRFLNTHRDKAEGDALDGDKRRGRKKNRALEDEEELSRFFASKKPPQYKTSRPSPRIEQEMLAVVNHPPSRKRCHFPSASLSSVTLAELPGRPFLGFGKRGGPDSVSTREQLTVPHSDFPSDNQVDHQSDSASLSRIPWSMSPETPRSKLRYHRFSPRKDQAGHPKDTQARPDNQREVHEDITRSKDLSTQHGSKIPSESLPMGAPISSTKKPVVLSRKQNMDKTPGQETTVDTIEESPQTAYSPIISGNDITAAERPQTTGPLTSRNQANFQHEFNALLHKWKDNIPAEDNVSSLIRSLIPLVDETQQNSHMISAGLEPLMEEPDTKASPRKVSISEAEAVNDTASPVNKLPLPAGAAQNSLHTERQVEFSPSSSIHRRSLTALHHPLSRHDEHQTLIPTPRRHLSSFLPTSYSCHNFTTVGGHESLYERQIQTQPSYSRERRIQSRATALSFTPGFHQRQVCHGPQAWNDWTTPNKTTESRPPSTNLQDEYPLYLTRERVATCPRTSTRLSLDPSVFESPDGLPRVGQHMTPSYRNETNSPASELYPPLCTRGHTSGSSPRKRLQGSEALREIDGNVLTDQDVIDDQSWRSGDVAERWREVPEPSLWNTEDVWGEKDEAANAAHIGHEREGRMEQQEEEEEVLMTGFWQANRLY